MKKATLVYIIDPIREQVLMAKKRKKIGIGKWFGYGGGFEVVDLNDPLNCVIREVEEETQGSIRLNPFDLQLIGVMYFYNGFWSLFKKPYKVICYRAFKKIDTIPPTTDEMETPTLFPTDTPPWKEMKKGDKAFVPRIIEGRPFRGVQWFTKNEKTVLLSLVRTCRSITAERLAV